MLSGSMQYLLGRFSSLPALPLLKEEVKGVTMEDHLTFVVHPDMEKAFGDYWQGRGYDLAGVWRTMIYPARHIALAHKAGQPMIGLSVPNLEDLQHDAPLSNFLRLYGTHCVGGDGGELFPGKPQHLAYRVDESADLEQVRKAIGCQGFEFIGSPFEFTDSAGATLRQCFFGLTEAYGTFAELVQRVSGPRGEEFAGFEAGQIDLLYSAYDGQSAALLAKAVY
ncbi:MAG TPA: hypothetical protein VLE93_01865 [Candidatus Saccharimonadales bacterium]|nr:hypothetical protein [Candidatus Saccharimonadales bacterium]